MLTGSKCVAVSHSVSPFSSLFLSLSLFVLSFSSSIHIQGEKRENSAKWKFALLASRIEVCLSVTVVIVCFCVFVCLLSCTTVCTPSQVARLTQRQTIETNSCCEIVMEMLCACWGKLCSPVVCALLITIISCSPDADQNMLSMAD